MKDLCGQQPLQIHLLVGALEERVAAELLVSSSLPKQLVLERLALRLRDRRAIEEGAARWAVESWAIALGVLPADQATVPALAPASPPPPSPAPGQPALAFPTSATVPSLVVSQQGNGQFTTISEALQQAEPHTRILVHPGRYLETLVLEKPVEIFAVTNGPEETVLVESHSASCLVMETDLAIVSGLRFWSRRTEADLDGSGYAIDIGQGRLVLEDCDVRSDYLACVGSYGPSTPLLRRCTFHESGIAVLVTDASQPEIVDCELFGHELAGIEVRRGGHPTARNCHVHDGAARGLLVEDEGIGLFEDCAFSGHGRSEVEIGRAGDLTLRRCVLSKGKASGLLAREQSRGLLEGCTISEHPQNGVEIHAGAQLQIRDTRISKCQQGILLDQAGPGVIERCELFANAEADIACTHQSQAVVRSCTLRAGKKVGLLVTGGSQPTIEQCHLLKHGLAEVVIQEQSDPVIRHTRIQEGRGVGVLIQRQGRGQISQCLIWGHRLSGVEIAQESQPVLRGCHIHNGQQDGILVHTHGQGMVEDCRIFRNQLYGIELKGGSVLTVKGCDLREQTVGILYRDQCGGQVEDCTLANHRLSGIEVRAGSAPVIRGCELRLNGGSGIGFFAGGLGRVERCTLESNTHAGILIKQESNPIIRGCLIRWGQQTGILVAEQGRGIIERCTIESNGRSGVEIRDASQPVLWICQIQENKAGVLVWKGGAAPWRAVSLPRTTAMGWRSANTGVLSSRAARSRRICSSGSSPMTKGKASWRTVSCGGISRTRACRGTHTSCGGAIKKTEDRGNWRRPTARNTLEEPLMHDLLKPGQVVRTTTGLSCVVERLLGGGGQGEVYRATLAGQDVALKWYFPATATSAQWATLERLITQGPPARTFLWPADLVKTQETAGFGYVMPLREARYKGLIELMKRRVEPSFRTLVTVGLELAHSYLQLHAQGLCYRDISFGNVFFDPETGEVLICDNDNVAVDGVAKGGVLGTPRFMAPEIVQGEALPSTQTDLYSLSVLLFYLLMMHHPLEGKREAAVHCLDFPAMTRLYGTEPLFIFDPQNQANAPDPDLHQNALLFWPLYPQFLRDLFVHAFTDGLRDPQHGRVRESEWRAALVRLRDAILYCAACGAENFYDAETSRTFEGKAALCWGCQHELILPTHLTIGKQVIMLNHNTQLFPHHVDAERLYDFAQPIASVTRHPTDPRIWGLQNLSSQSWTCTLAGGQIKAVPPGRSVTLTVGTRIHFGSAEGEIQR